MTRVMALALDALCRYGVHPFTREYAEWRTVPAVMFGRPLGFSASQLVTGKECRFCGRRPAPFMPHGDVARYWGLR